MLLDDIYPRIPYSILQIIYLFDELLEKVCTGYDEFDFDVFEALRFEMEEGFIC